MNGKTRFTDIYMAAGAMGYSPADVDTWEPYQFAAAWKGWQAANLPPKGPSAPDADELRRAVERDLS